MRKKKERKQKERKQKSAPVKGKKKIIIIAAAVLLVAVAALIVFKPFGSKGKEGGKEEEVVEPETIEAPARHINIVSEPIPMPDYDEKPEDKDPEGTPAGDKPAEHADGDPE